MAWAQFDNGSSLGQHGSENGVIIHDEEHDLGSRITLERECAVAPFTITCGVYGLMFHTRYFGEEEEASAELARMKEALAVILDMIPPADDPGAEAKWRIVSDAISEFVARFP